MEEGGSEVIRLPPMSPNLNAHAERFVRSIKNECLNRMIFFGQASLRRAIGEFMTHYHEERNHQGLENRLIRPTSRRAANTALIQRHVRLGECSITITAQLRDGRPSFGQYALDPQRHKARIERQELGCELARSIVRQRRSMLAAC